MSWEGLGLAAALAMQAAPAYPLLPVGYQQTISGTVRELEHPPFGSGVMMVWARVLVSQDKTWQDVPLYMVYLGESELPRVGQHCRFSFHLGVPQGFVMRSEDNGKVARIIDNGVCDPPAATVP
jgi:hypothetical protein